MRCEGCYSNKCYCKDDPCNAKGCAPKKELEDFYGKFPMD